MEAGRRMPIIGKPNLHAWWPENGIGKLTSPDQGNPASTIKQPPYSNQQTHLSSDPDSVQLSPDAFPD